RSSFLTSDGSPHDSQQDNLDLPPSLRVFKAAFDSFMAAQSEASKATNEFVKKLRTQNGGKLSGVDFTAYIASTCQFVGTIRAVCTVTPDQFGDGAAKAKLRAAIAAFETGRNAFEKAASAGLLDWAALDADPTALKAYTNVLSTFLRAVSDFELAITDSLKQW